MGVWAGNARRGKKRTSLAPPPRAACGTRPGLGWAAQASPGRARDGTVMPTTSADPAPTRSFWVPVICGAVILTIGIGARQSFGIFQKPIALDLKVGRELWSFGNALSMLLMGVLSPFVGNVADRFGTARTVAAGGAVYVAGMLMIAAATEGVLLTLGNAPHRRRHGGGGGWAPLPAPTP